MQVRSTEETVSREVSSVKSMYENELEDARRVLDDTAKEKARLQIENGKLKADADEWKGKYVRFLNYCYVILYLWWFVYSSS